MSDKKSKARLEMLRKLALDKRSELNSGIGEGLKSKKVQKVEVIAEDKKGLAAGLSKAQQILKAKLGDKFSEIGAEEESSEDEGSEYEEEECEVCEGKGCEACVEEELEEA